MSNNKSGQKMVVKGTGAKKPAVDNKKPTTPTKEAKEPVKETKEPVKQQNDSAKSTPRDPNKRTKLTEKANLNFNVNTFKSWLRDYFERTESFVPKPKVKAPAEGEKEEVKQAKADKAEDDHDHIPIFKGVHVALAAATEVLCHYLLKETISQLNKDASGLYNVSRPAVKYAVVFNDDLRHCFSRALRTFNQNDTYEFTAIPHKNMVHYIDTTFGKNICLDQKAYNLLAYLLKAFNVDLATHTFNMMMYAGKRTLNFNVVKYAIRNLCTGNLEHAISQKLDDVRKLCSEDEETEDTTADAVDESNDADNVDDSDEVEDDAVDDNDEQNGEDGDEDCDNVQSEDEKQIAQVKAKVTPKKDTPKKPQR